MNDNFKYLDLEDKLPDTSDEFYTPSKTQESTKTAVSSLLVSLNSKKTELKSLLIERNGICQRVNQIDLKVDKLSIAHQFLASDADSLTLKNAELLAAKKQLVGELKEWKQVVTCLKAEVSKSDQQLRHRKGYIGQLMKRQQELRDKIKQKQFEDSNLDAYSMDLEGQLQQTECQLGKKREERDDLLKMATTLQTFAKSFKKNIIQKEKQLSRSKFEASELQNVMSIKTFQKGNIVKDIEKSEWQCKMYQHHNEQIYKTNDKLKQDLQKLMKHLQTIKKSNKHLNSCIQEYSETGVSAAKKILKQSNK